MISGQKRANELQNFSIIQKFRLSAVPTMAMCLPSGDGAPAVVAFPISPEHVDVSSQIYIEKRSLSVSDAGDK
jgi:hypothetical protein